MTVEESCPMFLEDFCSVFILFSIVWFFPSDCCSSVLPKPKGSFSSVNYPSPYPNNSNCLWLIRIRRSKVIFNRRKKVWTAVLGLHSIILLLWLASRSPLQGPRPLLRPLLCYHRPFTMLPFCNIVNENKVLTIFIRLFIRPSDILFNLIFIQLGIGDFLKIRYSQTSVMRLSSKDTRWNSMFSLYRKSNFCDMWIVKLTNS